jgi:sialic acid synthase SpsE
VATVLGAKIIEIHITSDQSKKFIDNNVSFDYVELQNCVNLISDLQDIKI